MSAPSIQSVSRRNSAMIHPTAIVSPGAEIGVDCFIGPYVIIGDETTLGDRVVVKDALPFGLTVGNHAQCYGLNKVGVRRRGYSRETIAALHHAFTLLLASKLNTAQALERIREEIRGSAEVDELIDFVETSKRGVVK